VPIFDASVIRMTTALDTAMPLTCSCGNPKPHVIARRNTYDDKHVLLWDDGSLTFALGYAIRGAWCKPGPHNRDRALKAGWLTMGEVCLYEADELPDLVHAARWVADRSGLPGDVRSRFAAVRNKPTLQPAWQVTSTDRNGKSTERVWRLPELSPWAGHAVFDLGSRGRHHGRYDLMRRIAGRSRQDETYLSTGMQFGSQRDLLRWMSENPPTEVLQHQTNVPCPSGPL
jgi:hypothetical protein